jgi:hypothetical protein
MSGGLMFGFADAEVGGALVEEEGHEEARALLSGS